VAIQWETSGASANNATSATVAYPSGIAAGDLLVLTAVVKYSAATPPGNFTEHTNEVSGGAGSSAADTGTVRVYVWTRIADGTETGDVSVTKTTQTGSVILARMHRYSKSLAGRSWGLASTTGTDVDGGTSWSVTGSADPGLQAGDMLLCITGANTDAATAGSQAASASGISAWGTVNERDDTGTTTGHDVRLTMSEHPVTTGTSSGAPTHTLTWSTTSPEGGTIFLRLREVLTDAAIAESGSAADSVNATTIGGSAADPAPLPSLGLVFSTSASSGVFVEAGAVDESFGGLVDFVGAFSESVSAADAPAATYVAAAEFSESGSVADAPAATYEGVAAFSESGSAGEATSGETSVGQGGDPAPMPHLGLVLPPYSNFSEEGTAADAPAATANFVSGIDFSESVSAAESFEFAAATVVGEFAESGSASESTTGVYVSAPAFVESSSAGESFEAPGPTARSGDPMPFPHLSLLLISGAGIFIEAGAGAEDFNGARVSAVSFVETGSAEHTPVSESIGSVGAPGPLPHIGLLLGGYDFEESLGAEATFEIQTTIRVGEFAESVTAVDLLGATADSGSSFSEALTATDATDAVGAGDYSHDGAAGEEWFATIAEVNAFSEAVTASDAVDATFDPGSERVFTESGAAADSVAATVDAERSFVEAGSVQDSVDRTLTIFAEFLEEGFALETFDGDQIGIVPAIFLEQVTAAESQDAFVGNALLEETVSAAEGFDAEAIPAGIFVEELNAQDLFIAGVDTVVTVPGGGSVDPGPAPGWPPSPTTGGGIVQLKPRPPRRIQGLLLPEELDADDEEVIQAVVALLILRKAA
jgi:hypothetical protein